MIEKKESDFDNMPEADMTMKTTNSSGWKMGIIISAVLIFGYMLLNLNQSITGYAIYDQLTVNNGVITILFIIFVFLTILLLSIKKNKD